MIPEIGYLQARHCIWCQRTRSVAQDLISFAPTGRRQHPLAVPLHIVFDIMASMASSSHTSAVVLLHPSIAASCLASPGVYYFRYYPPDSTFLHHWSLPAGECIMDIRVCHVHDLTLNLSMYTLHKYTQARSYKSRNYIHTLAEPNPVNIMLIWLWCHFGWFWTREVCGQRALTFVQIGLDTNK